MAKTVINIFKKFQSFFSKNDEYIKDDFDEKKNSNNQDDYIVNFNENYSEKLKEKRHCIIEENISICESTANDLFKQDFINNEIDTLIDNLSSGVIPLCNSQKFEYNREESINKLIIL